MRQIFQALESCGAAAAGAVGIEPLFKVMDSQKRRRAESELPGVKSLICAVFPYFAGFTPGDISLYARGEDYHEVLRRGLQWVVRGLAENRPEHRFKVYVDASPYPETYAAALCDLGSIGRHGLLIAPTHGSFVFIGTIASTIPAFGGNTPLHCVGCGKCMEACPGKALSIDGMRLQNCASHINQLRGALDPRQTEIVARARMVWGCDICQKVCQENRGMPLSTIKAFTSGLIHSFPRQDAELGRREFMEKYGARAFSWRGPGPIRRNIGIIDG